jgi:hypothetical protein
LTGDGLLFGMSEFLCDGADGLDRCWGQVYPPLS